MIGLIYFFNPELKTPKSLLPYYKLEIKPCGLGSRIRDVKAFWYKTVIIYFVRWCWLCVIVWFTLTLNFLYLKLKNGLVFFWFFLILCYHARHLQQIEQSWCLETYKFFGPTQKQLAHPLFSSYSVNHTITHNQHHRTK